VSSLLGAQVVESFSSAGTYVYIRNHTLTLYSLHDHYRNIEHYRNSAMVIFATILLP
jgi:hypothetical protein